MMFKNSRKYLKPFLFAAILLTSGSAFAQQAQQGQTADQKSPLDRINGDVSLLTHYVEDGLSQSDKNPAIQGNFWVNFGTQFRLGVFGSSVDYANSSDNFNLKVMGELKADFNANSYGVLGYTQNYYYSQDGRNGGTFSILLNFYGYRVKYYRDSNWNGTSQHGERYSFGKDLAVFGTWRWNNEVGYTVPHDSLYSPFLDFRTALGSKFGMLFLEGAVTATSNPHELNGQGDPFILLSATLPF